MIARTLRLSAIRAFIFSVCLLSSVDGDSLRNSRGAVYPPFTVLQFAAGLSVPAQVPNRSIFTNLGTLTNIPLPSSVIQLYPYAKRNSRQHLFTHAHIYRFFEKALLFDDARECLLKTICQVSQTDFHDNLVTKLLHLLFSLSFTKNAVSEPHYFVAEQNGRKANIDCAKLYSSCHTSILDFISDGIN